jgi:hypothetical protein
MQGQDDLPKGEELSDIWYTFEEIMKLFNRGKSTINRWRRRTEKKLICSKMDGLVLFNKTDVENFKRMHRG